MTFGANKLFRRFLNFSQFLTAISRKLWRRLATKMRTIYPFERTISSEKNAENCIKIDP